MNKVITINLSGRAYQLEEAGFEKIQDYLDQAKQALATDPDRDEIIADLELAIAEKFNRFLGLNKNVIGEKETDEVLKEMGSVQGSNSSEKNEDEKTKTAGVKKLYKIREGSMIAGVCTGLAAYLNMDVTLIRIIFVALAFITHGAWVLVYLIMMAVVPQAKTGIQKAQAHGQPFTAQDWVERARAEYAKFSDREDWKKTKKQWKENFRRSKREAKQNYYQRYHNSYTTPAVGFIRVILSVFWIFGLVTLLSSRTIYTVSLPAAIPLWIGVMIWVCIFAFVASPLRAIAMLGYPSDQDYYRHSGFAEFIEGISWLAFFVVLGWVVWQYVPGSHEIFRRVGDWAIHIIDKLRHIK